MKQADAITYVTPTMKMDFHTHFPNIPLEKVSVIENGYPEEKVEEVLSKAENLSDPSTFRIVFSGTLRFESPGGPFQKIGLRRYLFDFHHQHYEFETRSPLYLFRALCRIKETDPDLYRKISFEILGWSDPRNQELAKSMGLCDAVHFLGPMSYEDSLHRASQAQLLYLPLERRIDGRSTAFMSTKLYEYLALKRPILVLSEPCDATRLVEKAGGGWSFPFGGDSEIASLLVQLMKGSLIPSPIKMDVVKSRERKVGARQFAHLLDEVVRERKEKRDSTKA